MPNQKANEIHLSPSQAQAVNEMGHNILVKASAGSGKTFVLIQRLMKRILKDHISIDQIVAMTFTDAASIEMRNRLSKALKKAIAETEDSQDKAYLKLQLAKLVDAKISTIHSFCLDITKQYYYMVGITASTCNNLIDEATANQVKHHYLEEIIADTYLKQPDLMLKLLEQTGCQNFNFDNLEQIIDSLTNYANEMADPIAWLETLRDPTINAKRNALALEDLFNYLHHNLEVYFDLYDHIAHLSGWKKPDEVLENYHKSLVVLEKDNYADLVSALFNSAYTKLPRKDSAVDKDEYNLYAKQAEDLGKEIARMLLPVRTIEKVQAATSDIAELLVKITITLYKRYSDYKKTHEYIDFNDFEHYAYQILIANDGAIAKTYQAQYQEILIDEFQDTNDIQYQIAELISSNNLFLVGDVKQSIYRFRGARPDIMVRLSNDPNFKVLLLKDNYRSKQQVIDFNNHLFDLLMNVNGSAFSDADAQTVGSQEEQSNPLDNWPMIFRNIQPSDNLNYSGDYLKAVGLAEWIIELLGQKKSRSKDNHDTIHFKDICVLVRKNSEMTLIKKVFDDYRIPCFCKDNEGYFRSYIIEVFTAYLKWLINPSDKVAMISVLSSCLYNYTDDDLVNLKVGNYEALKDSSVHSDYKRLKQHLIANDIMGLIQDFIGINEVYNQHLDLNERSNIDLLITKLATYQINSPDELVQFIETSANKQKEKAFSISKEDDVVQISTIHGSKGLQYNTVILYSKNSNQGSSGHTANVNFSDRYGLGFHFYNQPYGDQYVSLNYEMNELADHIGELDENLRVLYVALTRAEQRLYFIDTLKDEDKYAPLSYAFFLKQQQFTPLINAASLQMSPDELLHENYILKGTAKLPQTNKVKKLVTPVYNKVIPNVDEFTPSKMAHTDITLELGTNIGMEVGTRMHHVMEVMDFKHANAAALKAIEPKLTNHQIEKLLATLKDPVFADAIKHDYHREYPFYYVKDGRNLHGIIDFVSFYDDKIILIDYKTDSLDDEKAFVERYRAQLEAYRDVLTESFHLPVKTYIYAFSLNKTIEL